MQAVFGLPGTAGCEVVVEDGNVLEGMGTRVIHSSRTFDTDSSVVRNGSVLSQFLERCEATRVDCDSQIEEWTRRIGHRAVVNRMLPFRQRLFSPGELCPIRVGNGVVCLAAFCTTTNAFSSEAISLEDYIAYWRNVWRNLGLMTVDKQDVYVTIPGGRFVMIQQQAFPLEQALGIAMMEYFKYVGSCPALGRVHFCVGEGALGLNLEAWESTLIPYLWGLAKIAETALSVMRSPRPETARKPKNHEGNPLERLMLDAKEIVSRVAAHNGEVLQQFEGSRRVETVVEVCAEELYRGLDSLGANPKLASYLGRQGGMGHQYDRNALLQLLAVMIESNQEFGGLNRKSVLTLALGTPLEDRWKHLGGSIENVVTYTGQALAKLKKVRPDVYEALRSAFEGCRSKS